LKFRGLGAGWKVEVGISRRKMLCSALHLLLFDAWQLVPVDSLATRRHRSILNCAKRSNTGNIKRQVSESVCYFATVLNVYQAINDST
jgi:hypothetical protein